MNKEYIIKEDEGVVIAIKDEFDSVLEEIAKKCSRTTFALLSEIIPLSMVWNRLPELELENKFKGVSKCDGIDKFDAYKGMDIASCKADLKYHVAMAKKYNLILNILENAHDEIEELFEKHANKEVNITNDIERRYCREGE